MLNFIAIVAVIISSCVFGSISEFSEEDIKNKNNVVLNSSFENGEFNKNKLPSNWTSLDNNSEFIVWDDEHAHSGTKSLRTDFPTNNLNIISDAFSIDPESVYYTRCFVKTNYKSNHQIYIRFLAFNNKGEKVNKFSSKLYPKEDWTKAELTTGFFKNSAKFGRIIISIPDRDDKVFWMDDVESYKVYKIQK